VIVRILKAQMKPNGGAPASIRLMQSLSAAQLMLTGTAWKYELTVEEFLKASIGHELHHTHIVKQRYLTTTD
jgi:hypothetical protein